MIANITKYLLLKQNLNKMNVYYKLNYLDIPLKEISLFQETLKKEQ